MHGTLQQIDRTATKIVCIPVHQPSDTTNFVRAVRAFWPRKTAENLAARAGCSVRNANYVLAGKRDPSRAMIAAVLTELLAN